MPAYFRCGPGRGKPALVDLAGSACRSRDTSAPMLATKITIADNQKNTATRFRNMSHLERLSERQVTSFTLELAGRIVSDRNHDGKTRN
jgi:hypothetical protein